MSQQESEHIQESTLIPESTFDFDGDDDRVDVVPESGQQNPDDPGYEEVSDVQDRSVREPAAQSASPLKKNAPLIVIGALAIAIGGGFAYKKFMTPSAKTAPVAVQAVTPPGNTLQAGSTGIDAPTPGVPALPDSTPSSEPITLAPVAAPLAPSVPTPGVPGLPASPSAGPASMAPPPLAESTPIASPPAPPKVLDPAINIMPAPSSVRSEASASKDSPTVATHTREIGSLKERVSKLESGADGSKLNGQAATKGAAAAQKRATKARKPSAAPAKKTKKQASKASAKSKSGDQKSAESGAKPQGDYAIHIVRDNLLWVRTPAGQIRSFSIGDDIPGLGKLTKIDEHSHTATAGGTLIK